MSDPTERYLITQGLVGLTLSDQGCSRVAVLNGMSSVADAVEHQELANALRTATPSMALAWAECGFPKIEPSHKLAASFMATTMSAEVANELRLPWRAFAAEIPAGIIDEHPHLVLAVDARDGNFWVYASLTRGISVGCEPSLGDYVNIQFKEANKSDQDDKFSNWYSASEHERLIRLVGRFLVGAIAEIGEHRPCPERWSSERIRRALTDADDAKSRRPTTIKLVRPVRVDVRRAIREYAEGKSGEVSTRCLVRGHWKQQPHGERREQRKLIHVEPYWRGDEDAPMAIRPHVLRGDGE